MGSSDQTVARGSLLLAPPLSQDPNFRRSVVLLCEHTDEGSFGLILNRPLELNLSEVLEDDGLPPQRLGLGGPVQQNTLHYIHRLGEYFDDAIGVTDGVFWGGDFDTLKDMLRVGDATEENVRLFLGYAGWSAGQLDEEIGLDGWIVTPAHTDFVFDPEPERLWRTVLRSMGGEFAAVANFPDDPRLN
jgi:putative transcriptional regulator